MSADTSIHPTYAESFRCIGSACEDTCCQGWNVPLDKAAWDKYENLPPGPLPDLIRANLKLQDPVTNPAPAGSKPVFAIIRMNSENQCPLLSAERLCRIQAELGEGLLSHTCATYPRIVHSFGGLSEKALALSCPEAARLVLLTPNLLAEMHDGQPRAEHTQTSLSPDQTHAPFKTPNHDSVPGGERNLLPIGDEDNPLPPDFWPIRSVVFKLVGNREYPLWQRMFLLCLFCRRLDEIAEGGLSRDVPAFLDDFQATVKNGSLRVGMESLPSDRSAQLDIVLRLAGLMLHKSNVRPRFVECVQAFTTGIGNGPGATLASLTDQYTRAYDRHYAPFIARHPHIMENFLINTILRCQFPFGKEGMRAGVQPNKTREFAMLTAQLTLMRGLLIGVAGHHGAAFTPDHVVYTVQAASKHFEHHPEFLSMAHALLVEASMDGARGMAILLRDATLSRPAPNPTELDSAQPDRVTPNQAADEANPAFAAIASQSPSDGRSASAPAPAAATFRE